MKITIILFAMARTVLDTNEVELEFGSEIEVTVGDIKRELAVSYPKIADLVARSAFSVDQDFALDDHPVSSASEIALIPPVSGG